MGALPHQCKQKLILGTGSIATHLSATLMHGITIHHFDWRNNNLLWPAGTPQGGDFNPRRTAFHKTNCTRSQLNTALYSSHTLTNQTNKRCDLSQHQVLTGFPLCYNTHQGVTQAFTEWLFSWITVDIHPQHRKIIKTWADGVTFCIQHRFFFPE